MYMVIWISQYIREEVNTILQYSNSENEWTRSTPRQLFFVFLLSKNTVTQCRSPEQPATDQRYEQSILFWIFCSREMQVHINNSIHQSKIEWLFFARLIPNTKRLSGNNGPGQKRRRLKLNDALLLSINRLHAEFRKRNEKHPPIQSSHHQHIHKRQQANRWRCRVAFVIWFFQKES